METVKSVQELICNADNSYSLDDLKQIYQSVDTNQEIIVAKIDDEKHIFYRDKETRKLVVEKDLLPYAKILHRVDQHPYYSFDLCNLTFYDDIINRYGNGIIIPRLKKFVMVNDNNLIKEPSSFSFYTTGIDEDNHKCSSIVDRVGNIYRMQNPDGKPGDFDIHEIYKFNYKRFLMYDYYGLLIEYKGKPVFANICEPPYMILDKKTLMELCQEDHIDYMNEKSYSYLNTFDDGFMQGKSYVKIMK